MIRAMGVVARQHGGTNGVVGRVAAGGVGQDEDFRAIDIIEQRFLGAVGQVDAAHGDGDHFGASGLVASLHFLEAAILSGAHDKAGVKLPARDVE